MKLLAYLLLAAVGAVGQTKYATLILTGPKKDTVIAGGKCPDHQYCKRVILEPNLIKCDGGLIDKNDTWWIEHNNKPEETQRIVGYECIPADAPECKRPYEKPEHTATSPAPAKPEYTRDVTESQDYITIIGDPIPPMVVSAIKLEVGPDIPKCMKNGEQWFPSLPDGDMNQFIPACRHLGGKVTHYKAMEYSCSDKRRVMFTTEGGEKICVLFPQESK